MIGVQIIGAQGVIDALDKYDGSDVWGIYQGKQPITFGQGSSTLAEWLQMFEKSGTTASYTLRVYDGDAIPNSDTGNRGYIGSLTFKLVDTYEGQGIAGHSTKLMQRLDAIEKRMAGADDDADDDLQSVVMGWLRNPDQLATVIGALKQLGTGAGVGNAVLLPGPATEGRAIGAFDSSAESRLQRVAAVLDSLEKHDPNLLDHLEKLNALATESPLIFKGIIAKLDAL